MSLSPSPLRFGALELPTPLLLSPLAGYTNLPFRRVVREIGDIGLCTTDLVNARSLIEKNKKALKLVESGPGDQPLAVQLFGSVPEEMVAASQFLEGQGVASIDVNMGCPVRKVCGVGGGAAMMTQHAATARLVGAMVAAVTIPVTCKMRLGWDDRNITAPELARALEDVGVAAIMVHGRTRQQGFEGLVNLAGIRAVVEAVSSIPVIGNGDVTTPEAARHMMQTTGCAGVSIGRGAFYNPWIFRQTWLHLRTGETAPEPSFAERLRIMGRHLDLMIEVFGEDLACRMFRKVGPWYAKRFGPASEFNRRIVLMSSRAEYEATLAHYVHWRRQFLDEDGETLLPRYAPAPMPMNFRDEAVSAVPAGLDHADEAALPASTQRTAIPVPAGPQEWW